MKTHESDLKRAGKIVWLIGSAFLFLSSMSFANTGYENNTAMAVNQQNTSIIKGNVSDKNGEAIIGASVILKATNLGTITDIDGNFSFEVPRLDGTLQISFIGYHTQEITIGGKSDFRIVLAESAEFLDEVVVIGYGTMRKNDLTGAISSVKGAELTKGSTPNVAQALAGKLAGVQVVQNSGAPGGDVSILIRGVGTINDASPLYVIDGVPVNGGMWYLNPADIETIDILKDASATAIYGSRGANGVVIVSTKQAREGKTEVTLDYSYGIQQNLKSFNMLNASQFAALHNEMRGNAGVSLNPDFADPSSLGQGTDWLSPLFRDAGMHKVSLSIMGGNNKINHSTSLGYYKQDGTIKNTDFERLNLQSNIVSQLTSKFRVTANMNLSTEQRHTQPTYTVIANAMRMLPTISIYDESGNYNGPTGNAEWNGNALNSVGIINTQEYRMRGFRMLSNISGELEIIKGLKFKTVGGAEMGYEYNNNFLPKYKWGNNQQENTSQSLSSAYEMLYLWDNTLNYDTSFGRHKLNAMVGTSFQKYDKEWMSAAGAGRASDLTTELDNAIEATDVGGNSYSHALMSYMARAHYSYDNRYFLTATFRADGSSKFGSENRFGYFPSFSGAWNVTNEEFMKDQPIFSLLKLRLGYGKTGNQNIDSYAFADKLEVNGVYNFGSQRGFESTTVPLIYPYKLSNPAIKWESVEQYNVGFDLGFLEGRILLNLDMYLKNTNNMLTKKPVPQTSGTSLNSGDWPPVNIGKVRNEGIEITLNTQNFIGAFNWDTNFNISFNRNKVISLGGQEILSGVHLIREGLPIRSFYGYVMGGIYQNLDEVFTGPSMENRASNKESHNSQVNTSPGDIYFLDLDDNDEINDLDRTVIGNPQPKFIFGLNNSLSYKNFDLSFFFQGVYGNDIWNAVRVQHEGMESTYNQFTTVLERWSGEGTSNTIPRAIYADPNRNNRASTRWLEDGSYLRLKNLTFGYRFTQDFLRHIHVKSMRVYFSVDNVFTITNYSGIDPEVGMWGSDSGIYPTARTYMFGASVNF